MTLRIPEMSIPPRANIPPSEPKSFCISTTMTALRDGSKETGSGLALTVIRSPKLSIAIPLPSWVPTHLGILAFTVFSARLIVFRRPGQRYPSDLSHLAWAMVERTLAALAAAGNRGLDLARQARLGSGRLDRHAPRGEADAHDPATGQAFDGKKRQIEQQAPGTLGKFDALAFRPIDGDLAR